VEAVGAAGDHPDLGVDRFDSGVGQAVLDRGDDPRTLRRDRLGELDERGQATSPGPRDPLVEQPDRVLGGQPVDLPELLLEQVRPVQPGVGLLDARELRGLAVGEVFGVLPQRVPCALEILRSGDLTGLARLVSDLAADLVQRVGREHHDVKRVDAADRAGDPVGNRAGDPAGRPDQAAGVVIDDDSQVALALAM
jgi:hypothetical protein